MDDFWQSMDDNTFNLPPPHASPHVASASGGQAPPPPVESLLAEESSTPVVPGEEQAGQHENDEAGAEAPTGAAEPLAGTSTGDEVTERDKVLCLLSHFDHDQLDRYEAFRRGAFSKTVIRMIMQTVSGKPVSQNAVIAMAGITKVYIGEIVEEALRFREKQLQNLKSSSDAQNEGEEKNESGAGEEGEAKAKEPLKPSHVYEAVRRLQSKIIQKRPPEFRL